MDNVSDPRLENVLGSVAVAITGAVQAAVDEAAGHTAAGPAALTALRIHRGCSVDHLAGVLGLTHSGTVRLVDRLEDDGLLRRGRGQDARVVTLELTAKGAKRAEYVSAARAVAVERFLDHLDHAERSTLMRLLEKVVATGVEDWSEVQYRCRLCSLDVHMAALAG